MSDVPHEKRRFFGFLVRKERWGLSCRGWLILVSSLLVAGCVFLVNIQAFLAVTDRVDAKFLVVEGWVHDYAIRAGAEEFWTGRYQLAFATGGPVTGTGGYTSDYKTSAHVGADLLQNAGIPAICVEMVASRVTGRDRTYGSAVALRDLFRHRGMFVQRINVMTENVHARRTRLLFEKAFGDEVKIGIIAVPNPDYDPRRWWRCSEGVRDVVGEWIAYFYARFLFVPDRRLQPMRTRAD